MATDRSDRTREEGEGRNRWRQMIAQEEKEMGGWSKSLCREEGDR